MQFHNFLFFIAMCYLHLGGCEMRRGRAVGRKMIRTPRCKYTFVVKEVDADNNCPASVTQQIQSDIQTSGMVNDVADLQVRLQKVETRLEGEMKKNTNLNATISKQELTLKKADVMLQEYSRNFSNIFHLINHLERNLHQQRQSYQDLEKKVSGVVLDVVEMNNIMKKKVSPMDGVHLQHKEVQVESVSKVQNCGLTNQEAVYRDCYDVFTRGHKANGVYYITPKYSACAIPVWCDMETPPGGWMVIQKRSNGAVDFSRLWDEYKDGFGNVVSEYWLGLDNIFLLSNQDYYELRVDLWDFNDNRVHGLYKNFKIEGERDKFKLHVGFFEGSAKDGLKMHNGMKFSTPDQDNDNWRDYHCAREWQGGWWYNNCWTALLNGIYYNRSHVKFRGITWNEWKEVQLARTEMKIRPSRLHNNNTVPPPV